MKKIPYDELAEQHRSLLQKVEALESDIECLQSENDILRHIENTVLKDKERRIRRLIENSKDMIFRMSLPDGTYEYVSPASKDIFGYSPAEFYNNPKLIRELVTSHNLLEFDKQWENMIAGRISSFYEFQIIHKSGKIRWVFQKNSLVCDAEGTPVAIEGIVSDITLKKQIEKEQEENLHFFKSMAQVEQAMHQSTDVEKMLKNVIEEVSQIFDADRAWLLTPCDPKAHTFKIPIESNKQEYPGARTLGIDVPMTSGFARDCREALASRSPVTFGHGNDQALSECSHDRFSVQSQIAMAIHPAVGKPWLFGLHQCAYNKIWTDQEKKLFEAIGHRINDGLNSLLFLRDLQESKIRYETLIDSMNEGLCAVNKDMQISFANQRFAEMLGFPLKNLVGLDPKQFLDENNWNIVLKQFSDRKRGRMESYELSWRRLDGTLIPTIMSPRPIWDDQGDFDGSFSIITDISKQKKAEEEKRRLELQLRQAHKMEGIGTLAGGIAHDFNNILAIMLGNADIALYSLPEFHSARHQLEAILQAGNRAKDLIKHILMFSRTSDNKLKPLGLSQIINEGLKLLRAAIPTTIEITPRIDKNSAIINGDPTQIHQVLMNLATNAAHAMEDSGGTIEVTLGNVTLTEKELVEEQDTAPGDYVQLAVKDTGYGISPEIMDRIFDPYFTTKEANKGSGMGLAVVHGIIRSHSGFVKVHSKPGKGSTFLVYFPALVETAPIVKEEEVPLPTGRENILFVDDEKMMVTIGKKMLEHLGYSVTAMNDSQEALKKFRSHPNDFDLIITDQTMPQMTGAELSQKILSTRPDIPIILCSGYSNQIDSVKSQKIGIKAFATKPLMKKELAKLIRDVMDIK